MPMPGWTQHLQSERIILTTDVKSLAPDTRIDESVRVDVMREGLRRESWFHARRGPIHAYTLSSLRVVTFGIVLSCGCVLDVLDRSTATATSADQQANTHPAARPIAPSATAQVPRFEWDPTWPKPLPNNWVVGQSAGVSVDGEGHIWVIHRPRTLGKPAEATPNGTRKNFGVPAPPVLEFDSVGNLLRAWGPDGNGKFEWPDNEHGIHVDHRNNVWVSGSGGKDHQVLKFTHDGGFLMQIGRSGQGRGSNDTANLGSPAGTVVDPETNELWVADGYGNRRVIAFDAETGAYKRHFGAYGSRPDDSYSFPTDMYSRVLSPTALPPQFASPVHCVRISNDGLVYVCDRSNGRVQVFRRDGTFLKEHVIWPRVSADLAFSPDREQRFAYVTDFRHEKVWILRRSDMAIIGSFGRPGHFGGGFTVAHSMATDHQGNIYVAEVLEGKRVQRFLYRGLGSAPASEVQLP